MTLLDELVREGVHYVDIVLKECIRFNVPPEYILTILEMESRKGLNVYGHDLNACFSFPGVWVEVTKENYAEYKKCVLAGGKRNGVGPMQLTWYGFQDEADALGGCWNPEINIHVGVKAFAGNYHTGTVYNAFWRYNGKESYAITAMQKLPYWQEVVNMARARLMPFAEHRLDGIPNGPCTPKVFCVHTSVTSGPAAAATASIMYDGRCIQHRYADVASAANLNGNYRVAAFEFMDKGTGFPPHDDNSNTSPPLTAAQLETGAVAMAWYYEEWGIPLQFVTDSKPTTVGSAGHRAGVDGNFAGYAFPGRVAGGELWSQVFGKICPRDVRLLQITYMIMRAREWVGLNPGGIFMALSDAQQQDLYNNVKQLVTVIGAYFAAREGKYGDADNHPIGLAIHLIEEVLGEAFTASGGKSIGQLVSDTQKDVSAMKADAADDPELAQIVNAIQDPNNPVHARNAQTILGGLATLLEAHERPELVVTPENVTSFAHAVLEGFPAALRPVVAAGMRDVFSELADDGTSV